MENMPIKSRREMLKKTGIVSVSCLSAYTGFSGASSGTSPGEESLLTDFDPRDKDEVHRFANQISELEKQDAIAILKRLNNPQKQAYAEAMNPETYEITIDSPVIETQTLSISKSDTRSTSPNSVMSSSDEANKSIHSGAVAIDTDSGGFSSSGQPSMGTQDAGGYAFTISTTARSGSGLVAYKYEVTTNYGWNDDEDELTQLSAAGSAAKTGLPWKYRGEVADVVSNNTTSGYVKQTGDFGMCFYTPTCYIVDKQYPTISLRVYPQACSYEVLTRDNDN